MGINRDIMLNYAFESSDKDIKTPKDVAQAFVKINKKNPEGFVDWFSNSGRSFEKYGSFFKKLFKSIMTADDLDSYSEGKGITNGTFLEFRMAIIDKMKKEPEMLNWFKTQIKKFNY
jgi:hypothetical protein